MSTTSTTDLLMTVLDPLSFASLAGLMSNAILLLALGILYDILPIHADVKMRGRQVLVGILVGLIGAVIMLNPWPLTAGIFFDTRSVLLSLSGLFLGWLPTLIAVLITGSLRMAQGGAGMFTGLAVIVICAGLGLAWRRLRIQWFTAHSAWELYGFGVIVHVAMLLTMLTLPGGNAGTVLRVITLPIMVIYPVATVLLGLILVRQELRHVTELALRESEDRFRAVFEQAAVGVTIADIATGRFVRANQAFCAMMGYTSAELEQLTYMDLTYAPDLQEDLDKTNRLMAGEIADFKMEKRYRHRDGHLIWVRLSVAPMTDQVTKSTFSIAVVEDFTRAKASEEHLRYQAHLLQNVSDAIIATDMNFSITLWNQTAEAIYGWTEAEALGQPAAILLRTVYDHVSAAEVQAQIYAAGHWSGEVVQYDRHGNPLHISSHVTLLTDASGTATGTVRVNRNITDTVRIQRQMRQIVEAVPEGVVLLDADCRLNLVNPVAEAQLALLSGATVGQVLDRLGDRPLSELLVSPANGLWHEILYGSRVVEMAARAVEDGADDSGWVLVLRDVTEDRERQKYQQAQERLATVGQLAAGIAHDFNNIMGVIVLYAQMMQRVGNLLPKQEAQLNTIQDQARHASSLIGQILDFGRRSVMSRIPLDLVPLVKEAVKLLERTLPENIRVTLAYTERSFLVQADPARVQQAIMNLALNARDAMSDGGTLSCTLSGLSLGENDPLPLPDITPGEWVCLTISDTGAGIDPDYLPHLFEPFYTTKGPGQGTGLGLAQVYGIVKQHGGAVGVETMPGAGATFALYFPGLAETPDAVSVSESSLVGLSGHERILLVEDNDALREAVVETMGELGYRMVGVRDGVEALDYLSQSQGQVDLVLSDLVMPEMGGMELYRNVRQRYPRLKMAIMSGYPLGEEARQLKEAGLLAWITKPFVMADLAERVRAMLDGEDG